MEMYNESVSNDSFDLKTTTPTDQQHHDSNSSNSQAKDAVLEKFITVCRNHLNDSPNRRKKRYSSLRRSVARYFASHYWNQVTFENLLRGFSCQMESESIDHEQADAIFKELMKELTILTGHVSCSSKCRKRKKKAKKETTVCKLEKSLSAVQRRITRLKDETSASAWEVRDGRDGKGIKLQGMQKKALRLTKKINELNKIAAANSVSNVSSLKIENTDEASGDGGSGSSSGFNSNSDMDELNYLLKSVRLKESIKLKPKKIFKVCRRAVYPRIEMVEIKKFDQQNQCYVEPSSKKSSSKPMPFKIVRQKGANLSNSPSISSSYLTSPSSPSDLNSPDLKIVSNKSPTKKRSEIHKLRKQSTFDLICDRFRHVTLNS